jgi:hypothetical protein
MTDSSEDFGTSLGLEDVSPLRGMIMEAHEVYEELLAVGFEEGAARQIVAHILYDVLASRFIGDDYDEEDDEFNDGHQ